MAQVEATSKWIEANSDWLDGDLDLAPMVEQLRLLAQSMDQDAKTRGMVAPAMASAWRHLFNDLRKAKADMLHATRGGDPNQMTLDDFLD